MKVREQVCGAAQSRGQVSWSSWNLRVLLPEPHQPLRWSLELVSPCTLCSVSRRETQLHPDEREKESFLRAQREKPLTLCGSKYRSLPI